MAGPGGEPIMTTRVDITGNVAPLQQSVTEAKAEVKKLETETAATSKAGAGAAAQSAKVESTAQREVAEAYKEKAGAVKGADQELRQNFSRVIGGAAAVGGLVAALDGAITAYNKFSSAGAEAVREIEAIRQAIGGRIDIASGVTEYEKKIISIQENARKLRTELADLENLNVGREAQALFTGMTLATDEAAALNQTVENTVNSWGTLASTIDTVTSMYERGRDALVGQAAAAIKAGEEAALSAAFVAKANADAATAAENLVKLKRELLSLQSAELEGVEKIRADEAAAIQDIRDRMKGLSYDERTVLLQQLDQVKKNADARVKRYEDDLKRKEEAEKKQETDRSEREKKAEEEKKTREEQNAAEKRDREIRDAAEMRAREREAADRQAKALADAYASAFDRIRADAANAFPAERLIGSIETMIERLEALADQRSRLRG